MIEQLNLFEKKKFFAGQTIKVNEKELYIILEGDVQVINCPLACSTLAKPLKKGDVFGEYSMFCDDITSFVFKAKNDVITLKITEKEMLELMQKNPNFALNLIQSMLNRVLGKKDASLSKSIAKEPKPEVKAAENPKHQPKNIKNKTVEIVNPAGFELFPQGHKGYADIINPEYEKMIFPSNFECPNCKNSFSGYKVFESKLIETKPMRYDGKRFIKGFSEEWYDIATCPKCYFSAPYIYFDSKRLINKKIFENELAAAKNILKLNLLAPRDLDFVFTMHFLALVCAKGLSNRHQTELRLWSNIAWLYESVEDSEMHTYACKKVVEIGKDMYQRFKLSAEQEQIVCMRIAGMLFELGEYGEVRHWIFKVKTNKMGKKVWADRADELRELLHDIKQ